MPDLPLPPAVLGAELGEGGALDVARRGETVTTISSSGMSSSMVMSPVASRICVRRGVANSALRALVSSQRMAFTLRLAARGSR